MICHRTGLALVAILTGLGLSGPVTAIETIDCSRDHGRSERAICGSQRLQILDATVTEAYADVMYDAYVPARIKNYLQRSQRAFLMQRDTCGGDTGCLEAVMRDRVLRIRASIN